MDQKDLDKMIPWFKDCLVKKGSELVYAKKNGDISVDSRAVIHILHHAFFNSLSDYKLATLNSLSLSDVQNLINSLKRICPYLSSTQDILSVSGGLPIIIGKWIVGDDSYVS